MDNEVSLDLIDRAAKSEPPPIHMVFIPSHLTKGLVAGAVSLAAAGVSILAGSYAMHQFTQVRAEEVIAMVKPPT